MMSSILPVSYARHAALRWRRYADYCFAASQGIATLAAGEINKAALSLPLAFTQNKGQWTMSAVLSLIPGSNLYVSPSGQWISSYVPAIFRTYPFSAGRTENGEIVLCVDEASGLLVEGEDGESFFTSDGQLSDALRRVWVFLQEAAQSEADLSRGCGVFAANNLIEEWPINLSENDTTKSIVGLHRINQTALAALDDADFGQLRRSGLIGVAYAQLLSIGNLPDLAKLAQARAQADAAARASAAVKPMLMLPEDNTIDWDWSKVGKP